MGKRSKYLQFFHEILPYIGLYSYYSNVQTFQDMNNFESDPEEFAKTFCKDMGIEDPEVGVSTHSSLHL